MFQVSTIFNYKRFIKILYFLAIMFSVVNNLKNIYYIINIYYLFLLLDNILKHFFLLFCIQVTEHRLFNYVKNIYLRLAVATIVCLPGSHFEK